MQKKEHQHTQRLLVCSEIHEQDGVGRVSVTLLYAPKAHAGQDCGFLSPDHARRYVKGLEPKPSLCTMALGTPTGKRGIG